MPGDAKIWGPQEAAVRARDEWYAAVVDECQRRGYAEWFYTDRAAWLEQMDAGQSPLDAIDENYEALF